MYVEAIKRVERALFPIVRITADMPVGRTTLAITGCGFFIDGKGTFASVAHAFDDPPPKSKFLFVGHLPDQLLSSWLEITEVARDDLADISLGKVEIATPEFLPMSQDVVPNGQSVCVSGYPLAKIGVNAAGGFELGGVQRRYRSTMVIGRTQCSVERGRIQQGVLLQDASLFGMSGGAVVDASGMVVGMQGSVTHPQESIGGDGTRRIQVENGVAITSDQIHALYDRALGLRTALSKVDADVAASNERKKQRA